jgi:ribosomal protein S18 acetylase RimI-like enzyme
MLEAPHRRATPDDAPALAELVNMAGEGLPWFVWSGMAGPGQDPWQIGRERAARDSGSFSWRNAIMREADGRVVAALIGYPLADTSEPADLTSMPPLFVPLQQLEDLAPGSWYVNVLASFPAYRGRGHGTALLALAAELAAAAGKRALSLIVADGNSGAMRLYARSGFRETARRPIVRDGWDCAGRDWVLMLRPLAPD